MAPSRFPAFEAFLTHQLPLSPTPGVCCGVARGAGQGGQQRGLGEAVDLEGGSDPGPELSSENKAKALVVITAQLHGGLATHRHRQGAWGAAVCPSPWLALR